MQRPTRDDLRGGGAPISARRLTRPKNSVVRRVPVTHQTAAVVYVATGRATVELAGTWKLGAGDVLIVPPGAPHRWLESEAFECWDVHFCVSCLVAADLAALIDPVERVRAGGSPVLTLAAERRAFVDALCRELADNARQSDANAAVVRRSLLNLVLHEISLGAAATEPPGTAGVVADALRFIERHCLGRLTLKEIARAVGRSPAYVTTALTQSTGRSAVEWITACRMAEARRILLHSDERIDVIAERVGYADPTHFIRMFRRAHGQTPAAWRSANGRA